MSRFRWALPVVVVAILGLSIVEPASALRLRSQAAEPAVKKPGGGGSSAVASCITCHNLYEGEHPFAKDPIKSDQFITLNSGAIWQKKDPHAKAYEVLSGKLAVEMGKKLKMKPTEDNRCMTCHSTDLQPKAITKQNEWDSARFETFPDYGVSCTACHGTGLKWQVEHYEVTQGKIDWREQSADHKKSRGLHDLRDPVVKAKLCVSCHVGNHEQGKMVTHEMYAAGHPPLPPFELSTYTQGEPAHWAKPSEGSLKYFKDKKDTWEKFHFHPKAEESSVAREYAVGVIAALQAEVDLLVAEAKRAKAEEGSIDFARFDCYACHHDLKHPSERQNLATAKPPGRPSIRASFGPPAMVVVEHASTATNTELKSKVDHFHENWKSLNLASMAKPFGNPDLVIPAGVTMNKWCESFLQYQSTCATPLYPPPEAGNLLKSIAKNLKQPIADPETAMVLTWAYINLSHDLDQKLELTALDKFIPLSVRTDPATQTLDWKSRSDAIRKFEADPFREAFKKLKPEK